MPPFLVGSQGIICRYLSSCKCFNKFTYRVQTLCYWKSEVTVFSKARIIQQNCYRKYILKIGNTIKNKLIQQVKWKLVILKGGAFINFMELFDSAICNAHGGAFWRGWGNWEDHRSRTLQVFPSILTIIFLLLQEKASILHPATMFNNYLSI